MDVVSDISFGTPSADARSVDWLVVFDDLVLLVEVKSARAGLMARAGAQTAKDLYARTVGKAVEQIGRTHEALALPAFDRIPRDRPVLGLVAALDPWYLANNLGREFLPPCGVDFMVGSVQDIETLVAIGQRRGRRRSSARS